MAVKTAEAKTPGPGHNSAATVAGAEVTKLRSLVERIERIEEEQSAIGEDKKGLYAEAKSAGFDTKVLRALIRIRRQDAAAVEEHENLLDIYRHALGME